LELEADRSSQNIKAGIDGHAVSWYSEVFDILFADLDKDAAKRVWQKELSEDSKKKKSKDHDEDDD
jgi:Lon-like ATP-dependent protease